MFKNGTKTTITIKRGSVVTATIPAYWYNGLKVSAQGRVYASKPVASKLLNGAPVMRRAFVA